MKMSPEEVARRLGDVDGWVVDGDAIRKQFTFASFGAAMAFVNRVAEGAEAVDHHPDILINYRRVTLTYATHSEGGVTAKDFHGAAAADRLAS
jgi:4a-hydroxytetrahydrobiopterin dehydratase